MDIVRALRIRQKDKKKMLMAKVFDEHQKRLGWRSPLFHFFGSFIFVYGFLNLMYFFLLYSNLFIEGIVVMEYFSNIILINEVRNGLIFAFFMEIVGSMILWKY